MSQAKVDRYKEEKKNRQKIMKKQKREWLLTKAVLGVFAVCILGWAGFSVYSSLTVKEEVPTVDTVTESYTVDSSALTDYMSTVDAE